MAYKSSERDAILSIPVSRGVTVVGHTAPPDARIYSIHDGSITVYVCGGVEMVTSNQLPSVHATTQAKAWV